MWERKRLPGQSPFRECQLMLPSPSPICVRLREHLAVDYEPRYPSGCCTRK